MNQVKLDFQQSQHLFWRWAGVSLLIIALVINLLLFVKSQKMAMETNNFLAQTARIKHPVKTLIIPADDMQITTTKNQLTEADTVIKQLNLPWPNLFNVLEVTREPGIDLLELTPNAQTGDVLIIGRTENLKSVFDYMERLKKSRIFSKIDLNSHEKTMQNGIQVLKFTIVAKWLSDNE